MRRFLILLCIFGPSLVIGLSAWAVRSTRAAASEAATALNASRTVVPADTSVRIRLVGAISNATKPGEMLQAVTASPAVTGTQALIPPDARALVHVISIDTGPAGEAQVTLQLDRFIAQDREISVHSNTITAQLKRASDLTMMGRAAGELIGGAVGAAGGAVVERNPNLGAGAIGGLAAGAGSQNNDTGTVEFQILSPIDLTGIKW